MCNDGRDQHDALRLSLFEGTYGKEQALRWFVRWRVFFMACSELWGAKRGQGWIVSRYLTEKR
jgi:cyclopropane-fatty-acyl-phospholipid synthase